MSSAGRTDSSQPPGDRQPINSASTRTLPTGFRLPRDRHGALPPPEGLGRTLSAFRRPSAKPIRPGRRPCPAPPPANAPLSVALRDPVQTMRPDLLPLPYCEAGLGRPGYRAGCRHAPESQSRTVSALRQAPRRRRRRDDGRAQGLHSRPSAQPPARHSHAIAAVITMAAYLVVRNRPCRSGRRPRCPPRPHRRHHPRARPDDVRSRPVRPPVVPAALPRTDRTAQGGCCTPTPTPPNSPSPLGASHPPRPSRSGASPTRARLSNIRRKHPAARAGALHRMNILDCTLPHRHTGQRTGM